MEQRLGDRALKPRRSLADLRLGIQHRIGVWLIARGEKLVEAKPKLA